MHILLAEATWVQSFNVEEGIFVVLEAGEGALEFCVHVQSYWVTITPCSLREDMAISEGNSEPLKAQS